MDNLHAIKRVVIKDNLREIKKMALKDGQPIIGLDRAKVLIDTIKSHKPSHILEIGTNLGYSAILMSRHFKGKITTIEANPRFAKIAERNFKNAGLSHRITVYAGDAIETIPKLEDTYDLLFLDAEKVEYYDYLKLAEPKLAENAVIVADNVGLFEDQMKDFLEYVRGRYVSATFDFGTDAIEVSER